MAASVAEALFSAFQKRITSLTLIPSGGGVHEITANGELIYSKKQTGQQPQPDQIVAAVRKLL